MDRRKKAPQTTPAPAGNACAGASCAGTGGTPGANPDADPAPDTASDQAVNPGENRTMKIAIPLAEGKLCMHFGHCEQFALLEVDEKTRQVTGTRLLTPPPHEPGVLPRWLHQQGASVIIAGGMGQRAQGLFAENGVRVVVGAPAAAPEQLVADYLAGTLVSGANVCDH